jgi:hypothetical protein
VRCRKPTAPMLESPNGHNELSRPRLASQPPSAYHWPVERFMLPSPRVPHPADSFRTLWPMDGFLLALFCVVYESEAEIFNTKRSKPMTTKAIWLASHKQKRHALAV